MTEETNQQTTQSTSLMKNILSKKTLKIAVIALLILGLALGAYFLKGEFVAALVNGQPVSRMRIVKTLESQGGKQALDTEITKALIRQEAKKQGVKVSQEDLDAKISEIQASLTAQGMTLESALKEQGLSQTDLKEELSIQIELEKLVPAETNVSDEQINQFITENELKPADVTDATREQIKTQIIQQNRSGDIDAFIAKIKEDAKIQYFKQY